MEAAGFDPNRQASDSSTADGAREEIVIPVLKEELDVGTRRVETDSGVRINKTIEEREAVVDELLTRDDVDVERVAVNAPVDRPTAVRYEGDTIIIPVLEEVLVVEKRLILKEEIRVTRRKRAFSAPQRVTLRREHATVERIEAEKPPSFERDGRAEPTEDWRGESLLEQKRRQAEDLRRKLDTPPSRD